MNDDTRLQVIACLNVVISKIIVEMFRFIRPLFNFKTVIN